MHAASAAAPLLSDFAQRHVGPTEVERQAMAEQLGYPDLDALIVAAVPAAIRTPRLTGLPEPVGEHAALAELAEIAAQNRPLRSCIGLGYHHCLVPPVLQRTVLENPGWYTQYTPYQAEISQGRLECLLAFQTLVSDLTGLPVANASLLDESTAAAEAMHLCANAADGERSVFLVADDVLPQTLAVVTTRAEVLSQTVRTFPAGTVPAITADVFGVLLNHVGRDGEIRDLRPAVAAAHGAGALVVMATDPLACCLYVPPGELGADVAIGSAQRLGVPLGFGGPHAAFFATTDARKRLMPGRLVGVSRDRLGQPAYRLALQTREQHIRREKATSNICTAQALLANLAALYAMWHGPEGLAAIARRIQGHAQRLAASLTTAGIAVAPGQRFGVVVAIGIDAPAVLAQAERKGFVLRQIDAQRVAIALDEATTDSEIATLANAIAGRPVAVTESAADLPSAALRTSPFLTHPLFHRHRTETAMLRYTKLLESRDLSLAHSMIPLGSCTMKLNAAAEMMPLTWHQLGGLHPFAPSEHCRGWATIADDLEAWLGAITGLPAVSLQPNSGAQGEYAGLLAIRSYLKASGQSHRSVCLIPVSAHGTNPASAALAGLRVVAVACRPDGDIDLADLETKANAHAGDLACLMVTYPSTHGVFEAGIQQACKLVHARGGQVYLDGANLNAQVGLTSPGVIGADVCHINLHKTFCIPHGGGGPGMGPICAAEHLRPHLPGHPLAPGSRPVSAAPWGSASILVIPWMYIRMMGGDGLTLATATAILNANRIAKALAPHYPILYTGPGGLVAHECIIDLREFKKIGIEAEDVAKRLMDYGYHAPTLSFPVPGTLMIEPTESEDPAELDRFCAALIAIRAEISAVAEGRSDRADNPLKMAPHTAGEVCSDTWSHAYGRELAAFPAPWTRERKFWPAVARIDGAYGDRNLICTCVGMSERAGT
ncbi:glycine dehydrogenase [Planctomycetota bacterium]|nr:glycine dehydrogenase [Planctomycetota bacterium]